MSSGRKSIKLITGLIMVGMLILSFPAFSQEKAEIKFLSQEGDIATIEAYKKLIKKFESENPNVKVHYQITGVTAVIEKVATAVPAGNLDVFQPAAPMAVELAKKGLLFPMEELIEKFGGEQAFPPSSLIKWNGKAYSVPFAGGARAVWYRKDLFKKYGVAPSETWDELLTAVDKLCLDTDGDGKKDLYGIAIPAGQNEATSMWFIHFLYQGASQVFNKDLEIVFDNPHTVEAVKFYVELCRNSPPGTINYSWFEPLQAFLSGKAAVTCRGGRIFGKVYRDMPDFVGKVDTLQFLKGRMRAVEVDYSPYSMASNTKYPEMSKKFIEFLLKGENNLEILLTVPGHLYPTTAEQEREFFASENEIVKTDDFAYIMWKNFAAVRKYGQSFILNAGGIDMENCKIVSTGVANPYMNNVLTKNIIPEAIQNVLLGKMSAEEAVKLAAEKMEKVVAEAKK